MILSIFSLKSSLCVSESIFFFSAGEGALNLEKSQSLVGFAFGGVFFFGVYSQIYSECVLNHFSLFLSFYCLSIVDWQISNEIFSNKHFKFFYFKISKSQKLQSKFDAWRGKKKIAYTTSNFSFTGRNRFVRKWITLLRIRKIQFFQNHPQNPSQIQIPKAKAFSNTSFVEQ